MKKNEVKRILAETLPYPKLTIRADRRFDQICGMLAAQPEQGKAAGETSRTETGNPQAEPAVSVKQFRGGTFLKWTAAVAALVLVSFIGIKLALSAGPEVYGGGTVSGAQGNSRPQEDPAAVPGPVSSGESSQPKTVMDSITLDSWERKAGDLRAVFSYPAWQHSPLSAKLRSTLAVEVTLPDGNRLEAEIPPEHAELDSVAEGEIVTAPYDFTGLPEDAEFVVLTVYSWSPNFTMLMPDGTEREAMVLAEFTLDLFSGTDEPTEKFRERGYESISVTDCAGLLNGELQFNGHIFDAFMGMGVGNPPVPDEVQAETADRDPNLRSWEIHFYCDTLESLPYEARFFINGELYRTVPLAQSAEGAVETSEGYFVSHGDYDIQVQQRGKADGFDTLVDSIQSIYTARIYLTEEEAPAILNPEIDAFWTSGDSGFCQIVNTETEEVLYDSSVVRQEKSVESRP